jgi:Asp-tRNA(Asn)/Glu-tRNA(Gln) amidotransferase A subunit family amidase
MKKRWFPLAQSLLVGLWLAILFGGCATSQKRSAAGTHHHSFIDYWPPPKNNRQLCLAVKDNIDIKGVVTSAGSEYVDRTSPPAAHDAECLAIARQRNVRIIGKTNLSEFAVAPSGLNDYFGTPINPYDKPWHHVIPGGSSSGSAVAVANGIADVAFGTDTAGSVRVPAACCGIVGLKTTFGLVSLKGVVPIEPKHLDTVGPMGRDIAHVVLGMDLLEKGFASRYKTAVKAKPTGRQIKIGRLYLSGTDPQLDQAIDNALAQAGFQVVPLDKEFELKWDQAKKDGNVLAAAGAWMSERQYRSKWGVRARTKAAILLGRLVYPFKYRAGLRRLAEWQHTLHRVFERVDLIAVPTLQVVPPRIPAIGKIALLETRVLNLQNTVAVNFAGNPALAVPVPVKHEHFPVTSLQLVGPRFSEAELLNAGRLIEAQTSGPVNWLSQVATRFAKAHPDSRFRQTRRSVQLPESPAIFNVPLKSNVLP